jgi:hypothetical protein
MTANESTELRRLATAVIEMLDLQRAYFAKRGRGLPANDELEASKQAERAMRSHCVGLLKEQVTPSLFDAQEESK